MSIAPGKRYFVYSIKTNLKGPSSWTKVGVAFINRDYSINVYLDVLPLDGKLHVREPFNKEDEVPEAPVTEREALLKELLKRAEGQLIVKDREFPASELHKDIMRAFGLDTEGKHCPDCGKLLIDAGKGAGWFCINCKTLEENREQAAKENQ